jgi:putative endonuclease
MYIVYVLYSERFNKIYVGYTKDLEQRYLSHNELGQKGWTINFRPWRIVYFENHTTKDGALKRERELKGGKGREWIRKSILNNVS